MLTWGSLKYLYIVYFFCVCHDGKDVNGEQVAWKTDE